MKYCIGKSIAPTLIANIPVDLQIPIKCNTNHYKWQIDKKLHLFSAPMSVEANTTVK